LLREAGGITLAIRGDCNNPLCDDLTRCTSSPETSKRFAGLVESLAECIVETTRDIEKASMPIPLFGHVGDGNFHLVILIDPASQADMEEAKALNLRVVKRALAMEGTCTGEHGIGLGKQAYLAEELGEAVDLMRDIKRTFDPENLFNPGKVVAL